MKEYKKEDLEKLNHKKLDTILDELAKEGIEVKMSDYPKDTKEYKVKAILDYQAQLKGGTVPDDLKEDPAPAQTALPTQPAAKEEDGVDAAIKKAQEKHEKKEQPPVEKEPAPKTPVAEPKEKAPAEIDWQTLPDRTEEEFVRKIYWKHLGREPDAGGMQNYVDHLKGHMPRNQMEAAIRDSPEGVNRRKKLAEEGAE